MTKRKRQQKSRKPKKQQLSDYARYSAIGIQMAATVLFFTWGGYKIDQWLDWNFPLFVIILSLLGVSGAMFMLFKSTRQ